jgi:hypothetical protein
MVWGEILASWLTTTAVGSWRRRQRLGPPLPSAEIKRLSPCGFWAVLIAGEYSNQAASIESQSAAGKGERVEIIAAN